MTQKPLYIIDGHSQLFRAYYAIPRLSNARGMPTNAIYGFIQMLNKLIRDEQPEYLVVVFDAPGPTFRKDMFEDYKANRKPTPPDMEIQMPWVRKILDAMGVFMLEIEGVEADDVIGTLATMAMRQNMATCIVSSDKDLFQLVDDHVTLLKQHHDDFKLYDSRAVEEELGIPPSKFVDYLALIGDSSDNIPGVPAIGPKSAAKILKDVSSLEDLYNNLSLVENKRWRDQLQNYKEQAFLSKRLATIRNDVSLKDSPLKAQFDLDMFRWHGATSPETYSIFEELGFKTLLKDTTKNVEERDVDYQIITTSEDLAQLVELLNNTDIVAFDTETTSSDPLKAQLVGISFCFEKNRAYYIPVGHKKDLFTVGKDQLSRRDVIAALKPFFESETHRKTAHNGKYDIKVLALNDISVRGLFFDTMVASYLLHPERRTHNLKDLAYDHLGFTKMPIKDLIGPRKKAKTMAEVEIEKAGNYACQDADATFQLTHLLRDDLEKSGLWELYATIEIPLIYVLFDIEMAGIKIDLEHFSLLSAELKGKLDTLCSKIYDIAGEEFNLNSPRQVAAILFDKLNLKPVKSGKTGFSTDNTVLEKLAKSHPLPGLLLEYRMLEKLKTTYVDTLPQIVNKRTGKIHTSFNQSVAATGRLISSDPNLQNIPVRTPLGKKIRAGFIPSFPGGVLLAADYSQIELRILAHLSKDKELITAFHQQRDIHSLTASKIFGCPENEVTESMRDQSKIVNFGIIYGMGAQRLARELTITREQAQAFIDEYFRAYTGVKEWIDRVIDEARRTGFVLTLLNRRRFLPDISSPNPGMRNAAERIAINTPVQGTAADLIKKAMLNIHKQIKELKVKTRMVLQIHDELVFDLPEEDLDKVKPVIVREMEQALSLDVPIQVDLNVCRNWAEC